MHRTKANQDIKKHAKEMDVCLWQVADALDISYDTLVRKLRHELPEKTKADIMKIINDIHEDEKHNKQQ